jgi:hypothetical protein
LVLTAGDSDEAVAMPGRVLPRLDTWSAPIRRISTLGHVPGTVDRRFGRDGIVTANFTNPNEMTWHRDGSDVLLCVLQPAPDRILLVGHSAFTHHCRGELALAALSTDGVPDPVFATSSGPAHLTRLTKAAASPAGPRPDSQPTLWSVRPVAATAAADQSVVVVVSALLGWECLCGEPGPQRTPVAAIPIQLGCSDSAVESTQLVRVARDGSVDPALSWRPIDDVVHRHGLGLVHDVGVLPDGTIQVVGSTGASGLVARFYHDGTPVTGFGDDGVLLLGGGAVTTAVDVDGSSIVAGASVHRLLPDGSMDPAFAEAGTYRHPQGWWAWYAALQPSTSGTGRAPVLLGYHGELVKLGALGRPDPSFGVNGRVSTVSVGHLWLGGLAVDESGGGYAGWTTNSSSSGFFRTQVVVAGFAPSGRLRSRFGALTRRAPVPRQFVPRRFCFTSGNDDVWGAHWPTREWHDHFGRQRFGRCLALARERLLLAGTTEAQSAVDLGLDFAVMALHR